MFLGGVAVLIIIGCGGGGTGSSNGNGIGVVSGIVTDTNGDVVRAAKVYAGGDKAHFTLSNSSGAFVLTGVKEGDQTMMAEITKNGILYYGENVIKVFGNEQSKSSNVTVGRHDQLARLTGVVTDRFGNNIAGARVFANSSSLGSMVAITNDDGKFFLNALHPGVQYTIYASGLGFDSDQDIFTPTVSERRSQDYILSNGRNVAFPAPQNLSATAWTSPYESSRSPLNGRAYEAIKQMIDHKRRARMSASKRPLNANGGSPIEVDLYWDTMPNQSLLGFGIYRGRDATGPTSSVEFLRDPLAGFFADQDASLRQGLAYFYEITALNVLYPDTNDSESNFSNRFGVKPLGDFGAVTAVGRPTRFSWNAVSGAEKYTVYLFDRYPDLGETAFWPVTDPEIASATTTNTSLTYAGPALGPGTYFYIVLAFDTRNGNDAKSISRIGQFTLN